MSKKSKNVYAKLIANPGSGTVSGRGKLLEQVTRCLKDRGSRWMWPSPSRMKKPYPSPGERLKRAIRSSSPWAAMTP